MSLSFWLDSLDLDWLCTVRFLVRDRDLECEESERRSSSSGSGIGNLSGDGDGLLWSLEI